MERFQTRRRVAYSPRQMYDLVADVDRYPEFLPLCEGMRVRSRETEGERTVLIADMSMGYKAIRETITSRVTCDPTIPRVDVEYLSGPFSKMENRWLFKPREDGGCDVEFYIAYQLRSSMLGFLVAQLFDKAFRRFASAFEARARHVYGPIKRDGTSQPTSALGAGDAKPRGI
jgi:coenzyme Q-binding protein COQ10